MGEVGEYAPVCWYRTVCTMQVQHMYLHCVQDNGQFYCIDGRCCACMFEAVHHKQVIVPCSLAFYSTLLTNCTCVSPHLIQNANTAAKIATLKEEVAQIIDAACNCNFNASDIETASFSCMNPRSSNGEAVVLRMTVREKNGFGAPAAVMAVSKWAATSPTITISLVQYTVSSSCPTALASSADPDCGLSPVETSDNLTVIIASSVSAGILTLVLVAAIVGMVIWMCRRSSKAKYETDEYVHVVRKPAIIVS